ncbi:unnamed protein product [Linum trigynum]|uniref:S-adenosyl-L-methionine-dependent methyltransferases superfamily protein n=1 Tax=Linum trigynum TaxID=586398 RepID=A0AAV2DVA1_9ROSI
MVAEENGRASTKSQKLGKENMAVTRASLFFPPPAMVSPIRFSRHDAPQPFNSNRYSLPRKPLKITAKSEKTQLSSRKTNPRTQTQIESDDDDGGIPMEDIKIIARFKSRHNYIRVLEVSRRATDHPLAGSRLLLLDAPGNIHSISFLVKSLTDTYFDVFATLPPILPSSGPVAILGFGAGSTARLVLELYPDVIVHGWELDPSVIDVGREFFGLHKLESQYKDRLFIYIGNALTAAVKDGYSGIFVDLFSKGSLIPELQDPNTWEMVRRRLAKCGRVMVNVGGSCVEAENKRRDGKVVMEQTLAAMRTVFGDQLHVLKLGKRSSEDSTLALTGPLPDRKAWKTAIPHKALRHYVDMWAPF